MLPALFLDRDGVIIENRDEYVRDWKDVCFLPGSLDALAQLCNLPLRIVIVTNQSAVGRGVISLDTAQEINRRVVEVISAHGGRVDGSFMCPHSPQDDCNCRKPRPGLLFQAAASLSIDLSRSVMVGDALSDVLAGQNAGVEKTFLVRTGRGAVQSTLPAVLQLKPFQVCDTLADVLSFL